MVYTPPTSMGRSSSWTQVKDSTRLCMLLYACPTTCVRVHPRYHSPALARTPVPPRLGIKSWSSEKLEPRIPPCVNLPIVAGGCQSGYPDPCQSKPTRIKADPHASELTRTRHRPTHTHQNLPTRVRALSQSLAPIPLASEHTHSRQIQRWHQQRSPA